MASGKPFHPTKKVTHPITPPCCSSTNTREWNFASLYRKEVSDERPRPDPAPESYEGPTGLEGRMSSLQNKLRGKRWVYLLTHWHAENGQGERERKAGYHRVAEVLYMPF